MGVSHRRLQGWEPVEYTEYVYDDSGRLTGSVTRREPEWDTEQADMLLALEAFRRDLGPNGELMSEATSEEADPNNYESPLRFVAHGPFTNWAEKAKRDAEDAYKRDAGENPNLNGMYWTVEKTD